MGGLHHDDVISRSSGATGEDVILSERARTMFPFTFECKNRKAFALYKDYEQAVTNNPDPALYRPVLVIKQNNSRPLVVLDAEDWLMSLRLG
ncbi:MAG: hypothetical protein ACREAE_01900 [Nitrosopumilaceae archaeon]